MGIESLEGNSADEIVVFIHIFKAAGTSVQMQLRQHFGVAQVAKVNDGPGFNERVSAEIRKGALRALCGHFRYHRIEKAVSSAGVPKRQYISFVRDPIDRLISSYNYFRKTEGEKWHKEALALSAKDFFEFAIRNDPEMVINHQCKALSKNNVGTFEAAIDDIERRFAFVGLSEDISAVNQQALPILGFGFDNGVRLNVSARVTDLADLDQQTLDLLQSVTVEDQRLYQYVRAQVATMRDHPEIAAD